MDKEQNLEELEEKAVAEEATDEPEIINMTLEEIFGGGCIKPVQ